MTDIHEEQVETRARQIRNEALDTCPPLVSDEEWQVTHLRLRLARTELELEEQREWCNGLERRILELEQRGKR